MASSGNTWQKKLMNKARLHSLKVRGVKQRFAIDKAHSLEPSDDNRVFARHARRFGSARVG